MILLTGATGIVGSHILKELLMDGQPVRVLLRPSSDHGIIDRIIESYDSGRGLVDKVAGDILDTVALNDAMNGCTHVYHCAALVSFDQKRAIDMQLVNATGTENIVNACIQQRVKALCYMSSTAAIGDKRINGLLTEDSAWTSDKGRSAYSLSKRAAEMQVWRGREEGLNAVIVNPAVIIGSGNWGQSSTTLITSSEKGMRLYPPGGNGFISASDVAKFSIDAMHKMKFEGRFLLVSENLSFKKLFTMITSCFDTPQPSIQVPNWALRIVQVILQFFESLGLNIFSLSSENIASARRTMQYSNERALNAGFRFESIEKAIERVVLEFKAKT